MVLYNQALAGMVIVGICHSFRQKGLIIRLVICEWEINLQQEPGWLCKAVIGSREQEFCLSGLNKAAWSAGRVCSAVSLLCFTVQ